MIILSIGDRVRPGRYALHSRFRRARNFSDGARLVAVVTEEIGPGPLNVVVRELPARVRTGLTIPAAAPGRVYDSALAPRRPGPRRLGRNLEALETVLRESAHPRSLAFLLDPARPRAFRSPVDRAFVLRMREGAGAFRRAFARPAARRAPALAAAARRLAGCGYGLTPSGDDFLAGALVALGWLPDSAAQRAAVLAAARSGHPLTDAMLAMAAAGRGPQRLKRLMAALAGGGGPEVRRATRSLLAMGATSGADLAVGLLLTLRAGAPRR